MFLSRCEHISARTLKCFPRHVAEIGFLYIRRRNVGKLIVPEQMTSDTAQQKFQKASKGLYV